MPAVPGSFIDPEFGAKLEHLSGIIGFLHEARKFRNAYLARAMSTDAASFRRKRIGKEAITYQELSILIALYNLGDKLDYAVFLLALDDFKAALRSARVGTYAGRPGHFGRQTLLDLAAADDPQTPRFLIQIKVVPVTRRRAPIAPAPPTAVGIVCGADDRMMIQASVPPHGHLILVADDLSNRITCLMPSCLAPTTAVKDTVVLLPCNEDEDAYALAEDPGLYRLFGIWTSTPVDIPGQPAHDPQTLPPWPLAGFHLDRLATAVQALPTTGRAVAAVEFRITN